MRVATWVARWAGVMVSIGAACGGCTALIDSSQYVGEGADGGARDGGGDAMVDPDGPSTPGIDLTPSSPRTTDDLVVTITSESTDPLSGTVTYEYRWFRDDTLVDGESDASLDAALTAKGETWRVEVTPIATPGDRRGAAASAEVTIENTPPVLTTVAFDRYMVAVGETVRATPGPVVDPDGDASSQRLQWYRNGEAIVGGTTAMLATTGFAVNDRIELEAWVTDGEDESEHVRTGLALEPATTRWRPISPPSFESFGTGVFYDEQHRRWVHFDGTFLWERWVASGRVQTAAIPVTGVGPESSGPSTAYHDVEGRRLLFRTDASPAVLHALDLSQRGAESWTTVTPAGLAPEVRFGGAAYYDRQTRTLWGFGGINERLPEAVGDDVWSLSLTPGSEEWTSYTLGGDALPPSFGAGIVRDPSDEQVLYVLGGARFDGGLEISTAIHRLTVSEGAIAVETLSTTLPRGTFGPAVAAAEDAIVVVGGAADIDDISTSFGAVRFVPSTETVSELAITPPPGAFGVLVHDPDDSGQLLFWRGAVDDEVVSDGSGAGFELRTIDLAAGTISDVAIEQRPTGISEAGLSGRGTDSEVVMIGGRFDARTANPVAWVYRKGTDAWTTRAIPEDAVISMSPAPRWGTRFFDSSPWSGLQFFAGAVSEGTLADSEVWDVIDGRWLRRSLNAGEMAPLGRIGAAYVASGGCGYQRNYVFGGERLDGTLLSDAPTLECPHDEPRACYWAPRASGGGAPSARSYATMGLDGDSYVWLFGGRTSGGASATVHSFFACSGGPATWAAVTPTGTPPAPRYGHSMSLLVGGGGGELDSFVIFGGTGSEDEAAALNDAWRLEITSSTTARWVAITPTTAHRPAPRAHHQAFWDTSRSRLVVFGGRTPYDTLSDVWELIVVP